ALNDVNQLLLGLSSSDMFVTVFYGVLDPKSGQLTYANAGHNPPLMRRASGAIQQLTRTGVALGLMEYATLTDARLSFASGDLLLIYTDGVTEAFNTEEEQYGLDRLIEAVRSAPASDASQQLAHLSSHLASFTRDAVPFDDITFFIILRE
ncbi:MAG TPA: PP2C family protein-serine/threonine phosphatase, partial [Anaerolineales bacterium]|nr:PP2C family protein-serine/threonine phosphatase [Anaerolineales bacterium]